MSTLKCIAIDDEPLALSLIQAFIEQTPFAQIVATYDNALQAMQGLSQIDADLVFLDIHMPKFSGIELARWMQQQPLEKRPYIIFTTAYNDYAIEGYRVNAIDYLLKPFSYEDFLRAVTKTLHLVEDKKNVQGTSVPTLIQDDALFVKVEYHWIRISYDDILYVEGLKDYVQIQLQSQEKKVLTLTSLKGMEERLPALLFVRVHRSFILSLKKINSITKNAIIVGNKEITIGEQYRETVRSIIDKWLM